MKTELTDRYLWFDGDSTVKPKFVEPYLKRGIGGFCVDKLTTELKQFNKSVTKKDKICEKTECNTLNYSWNIPEEYFKLNLLDYFSEKLNELNDVFSEKELQNREVRVVKELMLYSKLGKSDILRVLIFVINTLSTNNVVWGVGRGSSVSSYLLYLIGVHDVDSVAYNLDIEDFLRSN